MAIAAFSRLTARMLAHLGEPARLRGEAVDPPLRVNIEHGVAITGVYGEITVLKSIGTFDKATAPQVNDLLEMLDSAGSVVARYELDYRLEDNGYSVRFILREA